MGNRHFNDIAIPISWPDKTARGDEKWMAFFAKIGIVKNLNFRVGHAAVLVVERASGTIKYFDFGRYLVPRGYGRARSARFDPRLIIETKALFSKNGSLMNMQSIFDELHDKEAATHGGGRTLFSICKEISFESAVTYAEELVSKGPILYGALANNNNSCSRYVAQILTTAMPRSDPRRRKILYPESLKASPTSNVVNAAQVQDLFCYESKTIQAMPMQRIASLRFQFGLLKDNFSRSGAERLGCDKVPGMVEFSERPSNIPVHAKWIGGIGEGAWFNLIQLANNLYEITRYDAHGVLLFTQTMTCDGNFYSDQQFEFTYDFSFEQHQIIQNGKLFIFKSIDQKHNLSYTSQIKQTIL